MTYARPMRTITAFIYILYLSGDAAAFNIDTSIDCNVTSADGSNIPCDGNIVLNSIMEPSTECPHPVDVTLEYKICTSGLQVDEIFKLKKSKLSWRGSTEVIFFNETNVRFEQDDCYLQLAEFEIDACIDNRARLYARGHIIGDETNHHSSFSLLRINEVCPCVAQNTMDDIIEGIRNRTADGKYFDSARSCQDSTAPGMSIYYGNPFTVYEQHISIDSSNPTPACYTTGGQAQILDSSQVAGCRHRILSACDTIETIRVTIPDVTCPCFTVEDLRLAVSEVDSGTTSNCTVTDLAMTLLYNPNHNPNGDYDVTYSATQNSCTRTNGNSNGTSFANVTVTDVCLNLMIDACDALSDMR